MLRLYILFLILVIQGYSHLFAQELDVSQVYLADPTIFLDNGVYYLYGTKEDTSIEGEGFLVYTSRDLKNWTGPKGVSSGFALKKGNSYGTKGFWAPQVFKYNNKYYMAYTANENIAIASSNNPLGPFINDMKPIKASVKQIDPFVLFDDEKVYMYHVRLQDGNRIFVGELTKDLKNIKPATLKECVHSDLEWENTENADWSVAEGPTVFKEGKYYYMFYSANDFRSQDYSVGCAISDTPFGPWVKLKQNPILSKDNLSYLGSGHGDFFSSKNGDLYYVLHSHNSKNSVHPRKTILTKFSLFLSGENVDLNLLDQYLVKTK